ncbi:MAG TPA: hypothetical protein PLI16_05595 [Bacteroidales bacterium]|mgnify:CR=1 FL=1|jgi:hypothetical protein|nr:hypothetical protein [Bacteroidales bacterium]HNZ43741.1 hypothetical protein [Bacteroidales bacterium]HOH84068.1 hypothetical protein [Bacteroidales bacterium]HPB24145.1 hypothetical protein [Bacteroidales bacterium]HPI29553.1 hypothetical protein [Bacteroidales bacterium]
MSNFHQYSLKLFFVLLSFLFNRNDVTAQHTDSTKISPALQQKWLEQTASRMIDFIPESSTALINPVINDFEEFYMVSFRLIDSGWIKLKNDQWIFLISSSAHSSSEVGDITIAMDNKKHFYTNNGHVCGGIVHFQCRKKIKLKSPSDFFNNFLSDTDGKPWKSLILKNARDGDL